MRWLNWPFLDSIFEESPIMSVSPWRINLYTFILMVYIFWQPVLIFTTRLDLFLFNRPRMERSNNSFCRLNLLSGMSAMLKAKGVFINCLYWKYLLSNRKAYVYHLASIEGIPTSSINVGFTFFAVLWMQARRTSKCLLTLFYVNRAAAFILTIFERTWNPWPIQWKPSFLYSPLMS